MSASISIQSKHAIAAARGYPSTSETTPTTSIPMKHSPWLTDWSTLPKGLPVKLRVPCLDCGEPTKATRCEECSKQSENMRIRKHSAKKQTTAGRGYGGAWQRLSKRARELQKFCSDCGATTDLQGDHSPQAWKRYEKGLPLRLSDIDVVCGHCNRKRGAARGPQRRSKPSNILTGTGGHGKADRRPHGHTGPGGSPLAGHGPDPSQCQLFARINGSAKMMGDNQ